MNRTYRRTRSIAATLMGLGALAISSLAYGEQDDFVPQKSQAEIFQQYYDMTMENRTVLTEGDQEDTFTGNGTVVGCLYITADHVVSKYVRHEQVTPYHRITVPVNREVAEEVTVLAASDNRLESVVEDRVTDIAVFRLSDEDCKAFGNKGIPTAEDVTLGETVYYTGNDSMNGRSLKKGIIATEERRTITPRGRELDNMIVIYTDAWGGDSGSLIFNRQGEAIGIVQASGGGLMYAKPITDVIEKLGGNAALLAR